MMHVLCFHTYPLSTLNYSPYFVTDIRITMFTHMCYYMKILCIKLIIYIRSYTPYIPYRIIWTLPYIFTIYDPDFLKTPTTNLFNNDGSFG